MLESVSSFCSPSQALLPVATKRISPVAASVSATNTCPGEALKGGGAFASNPKSNPLQTYSPVVGSGPSRFAYGP